MFSMILFNRFRWVLTTEYFEFNIHINEFLILRQILYNEIIKII